MALQCLQRLACIYPPSSHRASASSTLARITACNAGQSHLLLSFTLTLIGLLDKLLIELEEEVARHARGPSA